MSGSSKVSITRLVRGISAVIAGWNNDSSEPEYAEVRDGALQVAVKDVPEDIGVSVLNIASVASRGYNEVILDTQAAFADSAPQDTVVDVDFPVPDAPSTGGLYLLTVYNPSSGTGLVVTLHSRETFSGVETHPKLTDIEGGVPAQDSKSVLVQGWAGEGLRIRLKNDTALSSSGSFSAYIRVRKV